MTSEQACKLIRQTSIKICREYYQMDDYVGWTFGGGEHNDDRLTATVRDDGTIYVTDGNAGDTYTGELTESALTEYVADWMSMVHAS